MNPRLLETHCEWRAQDVADPTAWTEMLTPAERDEIDAAVRHASAKSSNLLDIGAADFPLPTLAPRLKRIETELKQAEPMLSSIYIRPEKREDAAVLPGAPTA